MTKRSHLTLVHSRRSMPVRLAPPRRPGSTRRLRIVRRYFGFIALASAAAVVVAIHSPDRLGIGESQPPPSITGKAVVVDGDTLRINGSRIRLHGIDAPESDQQCEDATGESYPCGRRATAALRSAVSGERVNCERRTVDRYGRIVAVCYADGPAPPVPPAATSRSVSKRC